LLRTLTRREQEVLQLLSLGQRYADIAERLSLSRNTVHSHAKKIYSKLLVKSKTEAGLVLGRNGNTLFPAALPVRQRQVA
jgi:LuxR family maltose regulon positive regulatory protein